MLAIIAANKHHAPPCVERYLAGHGKTSDAVGAHDAKPPRIAAGNPIDHADQADRKGEAKEKPDINIKTHGKSISQGVADGNRQAMSCDEP